MFPSCSLPPKQVSPRRKNPPLPPPTEEPALASAKERVVCERTTPTVRILYSCHGPSRARAAGTTVGPRRLDGRAREPSPAAASLARARATERAHLTPRPRCDVRLDEPDHQRHRDQPDHRQPPLPARGAPASSASPETQSSAVALRRQTVHSGTSSHPRPPVPGWRRRGGGRRAARLGPSRYAQACHPARRTARTLPSVSADARHQDGSTRLPLVAVQEASTSKGCGGAHRTTRPRRSGSPLVCLLRHETIANTPDRRRSHRQRPAVRTGQLCAFMCPWQLHEERVAAADLAPSAPDRAAASGAE